jgi:acetylornithine/N-succinyldiaminopimelate aminotransferase
MGGTGQWFAFLHNDIKPVVMTLAKSLGNGVPIGACLANEKTASIMKPGNHGSTFGGNPLACAAGLAVIKTIESDQLISQANETGSYLLSELNNKLQAVKGVHDIRGMGLMIGIELENPCTELVSQALEKGLLFSVQAENVIRLLPPLILSKQQADTIIEQVSQLVSNWCQQEAA